MSGRSQDPGLFPGTVQYERRAERLREELLDEKIPLPIDGPDGHNLLVELAYARWPPHHESRAPTYGALVFAGVPDWDTSVLPPLLIPGDGVPADILRLCADGRSSFAVVTTDGPTGLAGFEHPVDDEVAAVRLAKTGAVVVQRSDHDGVRICAATGVVLWNGSRWQVKPLADRYRVLAAGLAPYADPAVLNGILELAVHSLAAAKVGATLVWNIDGEEPHSSRGGLVEFAGAITGPALSVARRAHFPVLLSLHAQVDLATIIAADGTVGPIGARLDHTRQAGERVAAIWGARHTSARRFSYDVPGTLVLVISESGRVTLFSEGNAVAEIGAARR